MHKTLFGLLIILMLSLSNSSLAQEEAIAASPAAQAQSAELALIIAKVKAAYGGQNLEQLKSVRIQTDRGLAWPGQGQTADFVEFISDVYDFQVDLVNKRASRERWIEQNGNVYNTRTVTALDGGVASIDYISGTYELHKKAAFHRVFGVELTGSDTLIAYALATDPHDLILQEPLFYLGEWHHRVSMKIAPTNPASTAFINRDTGLITRFEVNLGRDTWNAVFGDYQSSQGITFARKRMDFRNDEMVQTDPDRRYTFNQVRWKDLVLEDDLVAPPEQVDMSQMTVDAVSEFVHHAGQGDYSTFIDAGEYIIATNPYGGLKDRYEAYLKERGHSKPLRYVLSTHHHADHLSGVAEVIELGATLVGTPMTIQTIEANDEYKAAKLQAFKIQDTFGPVRTYTVPTSHVSEYAIIYVADSKVIYQDDHYAPVVASGASHVNQSGLVFLNRVNELGLDVEVILGGHTRKAEKWNDFERSAAKEKLGDICPRDREICRD